MATADLDYAHGCIEASDPGFGKRISSVRERKALLKVLDGKEQRGDLRSRHLGAMVAEVPARSPTGRRGRQDSTISAMIDAKPEDGLSVSRRAFLKTFGTSAAVAAAGQLETVAQELSKADAEKLHGPGAVPVTLNVNGKTLKLQLEPRVTLLEALRDHSAVTGPKEVCDRATCGACTVLLDDTPIYACSKLAIEAQGHAITTVEGLAKNGELSPVQRAFVAEDALMCGYCTPGFVMSVTALLEKESAPDARGGEGRLFRESLPLRHVSARDAGRVQGRRRSHRQQDGGDLVCQPGLKSGRGSGLTPPAWTGRPRSPARRNTPRMSNPRAAFTA